ncbi:Uncharacterised protein [Candidatus Norongarragalina meridionalis]|nr:Uncharacterised protein [Candidatus Norongarragalina meridionalis]
MKEKKKRKITTTHIAIGIVILILLVLAAPTAYNYLNATFGVKDCGADVGCFKERAGTCSPARVRVTESTLVGSATAYGEIRGMDMDKCVFYGKIENATGVLEIFAQEDVTCRFSKESDLTELPSRACTGPLANKVNLAMRYLGLGVKE